MKKIIIALLLISMSTQAQEQKKKVENIYTMTEQEMNKLRERLGELKFKDIWDVETVLFNMKQRQVVYVDSAKADSVIIKTNIK